MSNFRSSFRSIACAAICVTALAGLATPAAAGGCPHGAKGPGYAGPTGMRPAVHGYGLPMGYAHPPMQYMHKTGYRSNDAGGYGYGVRKTAARPDIVATAASAGNFTTLLTALDAAGLKSVLQGEGPFTVFAPTDEAFANLPEGTLDALLADTDALAGVLKYHVVSGRLMAKDVLASKTLDTVEGSKLPVASLDVKATDVQAGNGVIHVIDSVLIPPEK